MHQLNLVYFACKIYLLDGVTYLPSEFYPACTVPEMVQEDRIQYRANQLQGLLLGHQSQAEAKGVDDATKEGTAAATNG